MDVGTFHDVKQIQQLIKREKFDCEFPKTTDCAH